MLKSFSEIDVVIVYHQTNLSWLAGSIDSILNQHDVKCVLHLVADGHFENDPVHKYISHPNIRLYQNEKNLGFYVSVNRIFDRLETQYIAIHDSDDIAMPHRMIFSLNEMKSAKLEMFGASMMQFLSWESENVHFNPIARSRLNLEEKTCSIRNSTRVMKKETFKAMNGFACYPFSGDSEFSNRCVKAGVRIGISDEIVTLGRVHSESVSKNNQTGFGTKARLEVNKKISDSYELMTPGFDPKIFGCLAETQELAHLTKRL